MLSTDSVSVTSCPSTADNAKFFADLASELHAKGQTIGVYTSESQWIPIMGDWAGGASFPL